MRRTSLKVGAVVVTACPRGLGGSGRCGRAGRGARPAGSVGQVGALRAPELSTTTRLADRRSLVVGDRFYEMGAEDGSYPATGFHTRGEMGGFWSQPIKLLDGVWFGAGGTWLTARRYTSGWGYQRMDLGTHDGVRVTRTDVAPDGLRAGLIGLRLSSSKAQTLRPRRRRALRAHEVYPWGETTPSQTTYNLPDTGAVDGNTLVFREHGHAAGGRTPSAHD